jgi:hypothetical protein
MKPGDPVSDLRLQAILEFYRRHWPGGELARLLEELVEKREQDRKRKRAS